MADPVQDQFGNVVVPVVAPPNIAADADVWMKQRNAEATSLMRNAASFNPDASARTIKIADQMGLDSIDESAVPVIADELRRQEATFQASVSKLASNYPELHDWLFQPNNAALTQDDLPQSRLSYDSLKRATDRGHVMDDRPELGLVRSFGAGEHAAIRRFGALALAVPAWISAMGSGRQTGPDAPASQRWFDSLWDAQTANDEARGAFQQTFGQRVSEAAGGLVGDPFTYAGMGVAAKLASVSTKAAVNGASLVAYGQEVASAYSDVARSNLSKGLSPYASPFQHVMVNLAGITTAVFEKVAGPVGELGFLNKVGGADAGKLVRGTRFLDNGGVTATRVILGGALSEGGEEAVQTLFENSATGDPVYARDLAEAGLIGGILGGGMGLPSGVGLAFAKAHQDVVRPAVDVAQSTYNAQNAATAMQSLAQSKLAQRAPQRLVNYAETLAGDKTYTVSKAEWDALWTKVNKNPDHAAVAFDGRLVNDTYEFSAGRYLALGSMQEPAIQAGLVEAFSSEGAPSLNKALEIMAELEQRAKDIKPAMLPSGAEDNSAEIEDTIYQQMVSTGATKTNAKGTAKLIARHYVQLAEEMNAGRTDGKLTPKELYDFKPISFGVDAGKITHNRSSKTLGDYDPVSGNVRLATKHNYSTALHEAAHHFLTLLSFFETDANAPAYFKEQMDRFRKWVGDNAKHAADEYNARNPGATVTAEDIKNTPFTDAGRAANPDAWSAQHEYFARGFEEWLREGKAPDKEVRGLFATFARWIKSVYKDLNILGVKLDDNSRQLFGRLFASQEMIDAANAEAERDVLSGEMLTKMGLSPEEVATIQKRNRDEMDDAFTKNVSRIANIIKKEDREKRQALRDESFANPDEFLAGPVGTAAIANAYIAGDTEYPGMSAEPGFGTGLDEASVRALVPADVADKLVAAGKTAKTGGAKLDEVVAMVGASSPVELAENMLTAPPWQEVVKQQVDAKELEAFGPALTKEQAIELATEAAYGPERQSSARAMAKVVMNNIKKAGKLADVSTQIDIEAVEAAQYSIAERLDRKDLKPAKWRKLANQTAKDANRAVTKGDAEAFARAKSMEAIALTRADIEEELADAYDKAEKRLRKFVETDGKEVSVGPQDYRIIALNMLAKFGIGQPVLGDAKPELPPAISPVIAEAMPGPVENVLTMLELSNSLDNIIAAYKEDNRSAALSKGKALDAVRAEMEAQVVKTAGKRIQVGSLREKWQKWAVGPSLRLASLLTVLDGGKPGVFTKLGDAIRDADVRMEQIRKQYAERLSPIIRKLGVFPQSIEGTDIKMSSAHKVMLAAHYGSETGRQRAIDHIRLRTGRKNVDADIKAILNSMTKEEMDAVEEMWKINEELFGAVVRQHQELRTAPPPRIKHAPFKIGDRQMSGGYMTLRYLDKVFAKNMDEVADDTTVFSDGLTPSSSSEKARKEENVGELDLNTNVMLAHIGEVSRVLAKRAVAKDIKRLFHANKGVIQRINEKRGSAFARQLQDLLSLSIVGTPPPQSGVERAALMLRRNVTASALLFNLNSALSQVLGIPAAIAETGAKAFAYALGQYASNPVGLRKEVQAESAMMRDRMGFADVNMHDVYLSASKSKFLAPIVNKGFWPIQIMQGEVDLLTYVAAKEKSRAEYPDKPNEFHVKAAERAVKASQGGASDTDLTLIQSGNIGRLISVFATAFNNMVNQYYVAGATGDYKKLASHVFWLAGVTTVAMMAMEALRGGAPDDEEYLDWYMKNTIGHILDLNPMTRLFRGTIQEGREAQVAAMRPPIAVAKAAYNLSQAEWDRAGRNMAKALPLVGPFPTVAAIRAVEGAMQAVDGDHVEGIRNATLGTANPEKRK